MKYKHIQAAHEIRMWVMTIVSAVGTVVAIDTAHPEYREAIKAKSSKKQPKLKIVVVREEED